MSETFTPLQSPYVSHSQSSLSKKQVIGAVTTLGLLVAIGGGMLFINSARTTSTKAYSTNECAAAGGYQLALCPDGTTTLGGISDGTTHSCCVPNDSQQTQTTTQTTTQNTPGTNTPGGGDGDQAPPPDVVPPNTCNIQKPVLTIDCPNGCTRR